MRDFGGIVERTPVRVVRPGSADEVAAAVRDAAADGLELVPRGLGHSTYGQSQTAGVSLDTRGLTGVEVDARGPAATAGAGASWREVLAATLPHGLTPPVLTDYLDLTVGGTLSAGGVGGTSHRYGTQAENVLALDVVVDGRPVRCSPAVRPEVFEAVRGGLGRHGVITAATLRLVPAPERVLSCTVPCRDAADVLRVQREVRAAEVSAQVKRADDGWAYEVKAVLYGDGDEDVPPPGTAETEELAYFDFCDRMRPDVEELIALGEWARPHPLGMVFLPVSRAAEVIGTTMAETTTADLGLSGVILIKALRSGHAPVAGGDAVLFSVLRAASPGCAAVADMLAANRRLLDRAHAVGGVRYAVDSVPS